MQSKSNFEKTITEIVLTEKEKYKSYEGLNYRESLLRQGAEAMYETLKGNLIPDLTSDPCEVIIAKALRKANIAYVDETDARASHLDFYLTNENIHIEVKQFYSSRIAKQMARVSNVIAIQGMQATQTFAEFIQGYTGVNIK